MRILFLIARQFHQMLLAKDMKGLGKSSAEIGKAAGLSPYIAEKYKGAQDPAFIRKPNLTEFEKLPNIKMITVAPEVEGALEFIKNCKAIVSLGHTDSDYDTAMQAIDNGALCLTHTFNAMPPMLHRNPGVIGAAIEKNIYAQLICDGLHVQRGAVWALYKAFGPDRVVLISDSVQTAGLPDGE